MGIKYSLFNLLEVLYIAKTDELQINDQIKVAELMVIGPNGEKMGVKNLPDALTLASYAGLDLVLMSETSTPPVAKIMDYNKYRYERQKKLKETQKRQRENNKEVKEYRLSVRIDVHDFETRKKNAAEYLKKGHKIKAFIRFKGREMAHTELGKEVLINFANALEEFGQIEVEPKLEGRQMSLLIAPKK